MISFVDEESGDVILSRGMYETLKASLQSVGTAFSLALIGIYLHRRGFIVGDGKRTLALISQQVTIPLFIFTSVVSCNEHWDPNDTCPDILESLEHVWILLLWPAYVILWGLLVGYGVGKLAGTPAFHLRSVMVSCAFGNSTGLPITLLTVVHLNFPTTTELGRIDPILFLSVYLLTYPLLQWGIGCWLLVEGNTKSATKSVLNNRDAQRWYQGVREGLHEADASLYISTSDLQIGTSANTKPDNDDDRLDIPVLPTTFYLPAPPTLISGGGADIENENTTLLDEQNEQDQSETSKSSCAALLSKIMWRAFQPPVLAALLGLLVGAIPSLRGIFVNTGVETTAEEDNLSVAAWLFYALDAAGQAAVPLSLMILGCNLSQSHQLTTTPNRASLLPTSTIWAVVVGKLVIMPFVGILSVLLIKPWLNVPDDIDAPFYLVLMIVFIVPTANNVMIMVELSESGRREGIAQVISLQYAAAPILLSFSLVAVVGIASGFTA